MSTPILNAPQSGILGMHKIQDRPMAIGGKIVIRPMMYLALSYDHRMVDGREAVTFLVGQGIHRRPGAAAAGSVIVLAAPARGTCDGAGQRVCDNVLRRHRHRRRPGRLCLRHPRRASSA